MKYLIPLILLVLWSSCKETSEEKEALAEAPSSEITLESSIPSIDFATFEKDYLNKKDGTVYVLNFWATWCKPCVKELPAFEKLNTEYATKGVKVVLVSPDFPDKLESGVIPFVEKKGLQSKVVLLDAPNENEWIPKVSELWSGAIPATLIVKDGNKIFYERSFDFETLETEVQSILK